MDQDTHQDTDSLALELLLEDVDTNIDWFETQQQLLKASNQPANRLEELEPDELVAFRLWKSEFERVRVLLSDMQLATALSLEVKRTFTKRISAAIEKLLLSYCAICLDLLLEDLNTKIDGLKTQLQLIKAADQSVNLLEELEPDRGVALRIWKSEIEKQRVISSDSQMVTASSPQKTKTFAKRISTAIQKLLLPLKNIMRSIKASVLTHSKPEACSSCTEVRSEVFKTQCSHIYCKNCLTYMVTKSLQGESSFPLQCCHKPIEGSSMKKMIGSALSQEQKKRQTEISDRDRTYCSDAKCSRYIPPVVKFWPNFTSQTVGTCKCGVRTCRKCKRNAHAGKCLYQLDQSLEKLMKKKKWQRCAKCGRVIELSQGCSHIT
ncbi:putative E3 ubiquitin-protein ligase [Penicillium chrysogenum]|jgi:hypothetical protein|nr:uncharacterized protein N7525_001455 [Penicillium rubens]KAJ5256200.1 hypothetical protein N7505_011351 [Penicillium chrysogenum]MBZ6431473.1 E3 ubiquitin protein ligase [Acinetobacter pittii]KAJ5034560.1 hypothetical protein NUH16_005999 [Penicillium rubens]KAJ5277224.1 hypothetical protein N7524_003377 [Penicillium chrysogenum]KAJ5843714.1 hypothetical protein N7525_001455 [Penicillium rubens]